MTEEQVGNTASGLPAAGSTSPSYVVGVGASAGGLDALERLFDAMPTDSGMAFVVVQHLSPDFKSLMNELLARHTRMAIQVVTDGVELQPNTIYLIPPKKNMILQDGRLRLSEQVPGSLNMPIDVFFRSLAQDAGKRAIGIVLSGTGSDGSRGIRDISSAGGLVIVQSIQSAAFDGMPRNSLGTGVADIVCPPGNMATRIYEYIRNPGTFTADSDAPQSPDDSDLAEIFRMFRNQYGIDFGYYKQTTIGRRLERRVKLARCDSLNAYLRRLEADPRELDVLYRDLLVEVTQFFRDLEAFQRLQREVIPELVERATIHGELRVWTPGCATGEESYSMAMLLMDCIERQGLDLDFKVFATDVHHTSMETASAGVYSAQSTSRMPTEFKDKYFVRIGDLYHVSNKIRQHVIFAPHDITKDPPFSRIDLISCRNVLIYLQPVLQKRILGNFEFSLNGNGYLMLGSSETTGDGFETLVSVDHKWKVFQYKGLKGRMSPPALTRLGLRTVGRGALIPSHGHGSAGVPRTPDAFLRRMLDVLATPCLVIDMNQNLLHSFGEVKQFLSAPSGFGISLDVLKMVPQELSVAIATASHKTIKEDIEVLYENVSFSSLGKTYTVHLRTVPFQLEGELTDSVLILLEPVREKEARENHDEAVFDLSATSNQRIRDLEVELQHTRENMQALVEELETSNEELQATNEELLAANEELQSTNEELQAVNEELLTVNGEYQTKIRELVELNDDMDNLFRNTSVGTLFLDNRLLVRKFTPLAQTEFNLLEQDIGRAFYHLTHNFERLDIGELARKVLDTLETLEFEARSSRNLWYLFKIMPFRTSNNSVNGVILTMVDITKVQQRAQKSAGLDRDTVLPGLASDCLVFLEDWQIVMANNAVSQLLQMPDTVFPVGKPFAEILHEDFRETCQALCRTSSVDDSIVLALKSVADDKPVWVEARLESSQLRKMKLEV
ncbi:MAG: PAS domain-containing protein, partial [Planctomycetaceae bacterium]|nr:PAS domain-containing protein [Planctomycetaceae bacterium]